VVNLIQFAQNFVQQSILLAMKLRYVNTAWANARSFQTQKRDHIIIDNI
jgi:Holliday junction resolvase